MSAVFKPGGTATGPDWQYRIERNGAFTAWFDWTIDLVFDTDPDGDELRIGVLYWAYARNAQLPDGEFGSLLQPFAVSFEITESGRVVPGSSDGEVDVDSPLYPVVLTAPAEAQPIVLHWNTALAHYELVNGVITTLLNLTNAASNSDLANVANQLLPFATGQITGDDRPVLAVYCYDDGEAAAKDEYLGFLNATMMGIPQLHNLGVVGGRLFRQLNDANGQPDQSTVLSFPDTNHFQIDYAEGVSDYPGGTIWLKIIYS